MATKIREEIERWLDRAEARGMASYGKSLDDANDGRDWGIELIQELCDGLQYAAKELREVRAENARLREQLKTPFED